MNDPKLKDTPDHRPGAVRTPIMVGSCPHLRTAVDRQADGVLRSVPDRTVEAATRHEAHGAGTFSSRFQGRFRPALHNGGFHLSQDKL